MKQILIPLKNTRNPADRRKTTVQPLSLNESRIAEIQRCTYYEGRFFLWPSEMQIRRKLKGCSVMGRRQGIMSDEFKYELAKDLGFYDTVKKDGWGAIRSRDAGNMVKRAIELAEQHMSSQKHS